MATEIYFNDTGTALSSGIDSSVTAFVANSVAAFPNPFTSSQFRIRIDDEIMIVTDINVGTRALTVTRGAESTTPQPHQAGAQIVHILTAGGLQSILAQSSSSYVGAQSSLPGSYAVAGSAYFGTDKPYINIWNGSSYTQYFSPLVVPPPAASNWTAINYNAANCTYGDTPGGGVYIMHSGSGGSQRIIAMPVPATPYKVMMRMKLLTASNDSNAWAGAYWLENTSSSAKFTMAVVRGNSCYITYNGSSVASPSFGQVYDPTDRTLGLGGGDLSLVFQDDGATNRTLYFSNDGYTYLTSPNWPRGRTDNAAYTYLGIGINGGAFACCTLYSYRVF